MSKFTKRAMALSLSVLALAGISCEQFEYASPLPGIIEVRLASKNTRLNLVPYGGENNFTLTLQTLEVFLPGDIKLPVYATLNAIRRNRDLDRYNTLSFAARDSSIVMGAAYAPPGTYESMLIVMEPSPGLLKDFGTHFSFISVQPVTGFATTIRFRNLSIPIEEGRTTVVTITYDMDESLIQRARFFNYTPSYRVSSVVMK